MPRWPPSWAKATAPWCGCWARRENWSAFCSWEIANSALADEDNQVLQAIAGHAAVALENARLFTRMDQANRHWVEIFDAISDFIVAHDEAGNVLRVNRSLADFIGVQPQALIGVNMSALLAMGDAPPPRSCPFCRSTTDGR